MMPGSSSVQNSAPWGALVFSGPALLSGSHQARGEAPRVHMPFSWAVM